MKKEEKELEIAGKCKHCHTTIYKTPNGDLLIKGSWDCIHELELEVEDGSK